jgi:hypothetical protein
MLLLLNRVFNVLLWDFTFASSPSITSLQKILEKKEKSKFINPSKKNKEI